LSEQKSAFQVGSKRQAMPVCVASAIRWTSSNRASGDQVDQAGHARSLKVAVSRSALTSPFFLECFHQNHSLVEPVAPTLGLRATALNQRFG
jgi:hypothetical protein